MVVKTECRGHRAVGLNVGATNALRYFRRKTAQVDLQLGDLRISCNLEPEFWHGRPIIYDPRLCAWLECKVLHPNGHRRNSVEVALIPNGLNSFRVELAPVRSDRKDATTQKEDVASEIDLVPETSAPDALAGSIARVHPARQPFPPQSETPVPGSRLLLLAQTGS